LVAEQFCDNTEVRSTNEPRVQRVDDVVAVTQALSHANSVTVNCEGAPHTAHGGVDLDRRFSINISLYLRNGARQGHSHYETLIGTRMHPIKRRYFQ